MKQFIEHQYRLYRGFLFDGKRLLITSLRVGAADLHAARLRWKKNRRRASASDTPGVAAILKDTHFPEAPVRITFAGAVRKVGNPNHRMDRFLQTLLENVKDVSRVEVLLGIDEDDDIDYFVALKKKFGGRVRLRIFISPIQFGYERLHMYDTVLLPHMAGGSRMMGRCSDDCVFKLKDFDERLLEIDARYPDNIYFIHTRCTQREVYLGDASREIYRLFWIFHTIRGCHSYFPIISKGILKGAHQALQLLPEEERNRWSPYANGAIVDCYVDILANFLKAEGIDRIHELDMLDIRHGIYVDWQHKVDSNKLSANDRFFIKMLGLDTQAHLRAIAHTLMLSAQHETGEALKTTPVHA